MNLFAQMSRLDCPMLAYIGIEDVRDFAASGFFWLIFFLVPVLGVAALVFDGFSGPLRRRRRTKMFLDLLEIGFRQGQRPEIALALAAQTNDRSLGKLFQQVAARLREGVRLSQALDEVPHFLPPQVTATLRVGEEVGDMLKVLPACRGLLKDAGSQTRSAFNFMVISNMVLLPTMSILILLLNIFVFPTFRAILDDYDQTPPAVFLLVTRIGFWVAGAQLLLAFSLWCLAWFYIRGPRSYGSVRVDRKQMPAAPVPSKPLWKLSGAGFKSRLEFGPIWKVPLWDFIGRPLAPLRDRILYALPWRRRRLQRDFCATLSLLLDSGTPEGAAVTLAAEATANYVFIRRARLALEDLSAGRTLQASLQRFDNAGEFSWRLANAAAQQGGFLSALAGWIEALDARAFQQEQTASQIVSTGLVLCNGLAVGLIATGIFSVLISLGG